MSKKDQPKSLCCLCKYFNAQHDDSCNVWYGCWKDTEEKTIESEACSKFEHYIERRGINEKN